MTVAWACSRGYAYTEFELEAGMSFATMDYIMDRAESEHDLEQDLACEDRLARNHVNEDSDLPWPWYADEPCDVEEPEVIQA